MFSAWQSRIQEKEMTGEYAARDREHYDREAHEAGADLCRCGELPITTTSSGERLCRRCAAAEEVFVSRIQERGA